MLPTAEIVRVIDDARLIDPESYERSYETGHGTTLAPGYYVVVWPDDVDCPRYDAQATFMGPIVDAAEARRVLERRLGRT
jgi:hypothetical protein